MTPTPNVEVNISLTYPNSGGIAHLEIGDRASGCGILNIVLNAEQFMQLIHSHYLTVPAWVLPSEFRARIGQQRVGVEEDVPSDLQPEWNQDAAVLYEYAEAQRIAGGWDEARPYKTNHGWVLSLCRWEAKQEKPG